MENDKNIQKIPHNLIVENRQRMSATGVLDVDSFDEQTIVLLTQIGVLKIEGEDLHINRLNVESGDVEICGTINSFGYLKIEEKNKGSVLQRLFH